jgi:hypothetical protein
MSDWRTLTRFDSTWSKSLDLDACLTLTFLRWFCGAIDKPKFTWFWGPNQENVTVILRSKSSNWSYWFWCVNWETVDLDFEAKLRNTCSLCTVWIAHDVIRPSDCPTTEYSICAWPSRSSTRGLIFLPWSSSLYDMSQLSHTHYETSNNDCSHEIKIIGLNHRIVPNSNSNINISITHYISNQYIYHLISHTYSTRVYSDDTASFTTW